MVARPGRGGRETDHPERGGDPGKPQAQVKNPAAILIYPPVAKPCEPPAGIAKLAGSLGRHGLPFRIVDANIQCLLALLDEAPELRDTWTSRAWRHLSDHLRDLRSSEGYGHPDRYRRAVLDVNRVLEKSVHNEEIRVGLVNYADKTLSPLRSKDLLRAAEEPERNPFYTCFRKQFEPLEDEEPAAVGFSLNYLSQALCTFAMIGFLRRERPHLSIILGGGLVTSWMRSPAWKNPFSGLVDEMVAGPGEEALVSFMGRTWSTGVIPPEYDSFLEYPYFSPGWILPYSASTGCYWRQCSFCPEKAEGNPYKPIAPARAVEEVKGIGSRVKPALVHFLDNAMSPSLLEELSTRPLDLPWYGFVRITSHLADKNFCLSLKRSGCVMLKLGLESGDQQVLDRLQKGIDLEMASRALKSVKGAGISTYVYLLFGTPAETYEKARKTLDFVVKHSESIDFLNLAIFNMPLRNQEDQGIKTTPFYDGDLSLYTGFDHPSGWNRPLVRNFVEKEVRRHPALAPILRRDPPLFTSNHAPFFCNK
jgi:hypothetical protein